MGILETRSARFFPLTRNDVSRRELQQQRHRTRRVPRGTSSSRAEASVRARSPPDLRENAPLLENAFSGIRKGDDGRSSRVAAVRSFGVSPFDVAFGVEETFVLVTVAGFIAYIALNFEEIVAKQKVAVEKAMAEQDKNVNDAMAKQKRDIDAAM